MGNDGGLVTHPTARPPADIATLFDAEGSAIFSYLLLRCGSRSVAEDLTSETFLAAANAASSGTTNTITPAWLQTVAKRRLVDHWRAQFSQRRRLERLERQTVPPTETDADPDGRVEAALDSLPDRQRAVLVLRYLDEFSVSEVAAALGLGYKATESLLSRARRSFATAYGAHDGT